MYRILNSGSEFFFGILLETNEAARDWDIQNAMPILHRLVFHQNPSISMEMRANTLQARYKVEYKVQPQTHSVKNSNTYLAKVSTHTLWKY